VASFFEVADDGDPLSPREVVSILQPLVHGLTRFTNEVTDLLVGISDQLFRFQIVFQNHITHLKSVPTYAALVDERYCRSVLDVNLDAQAARLKTPDTYVNATVPSILVTSLKMVCKCGNIASFG